ncbi:MAG: DUF721 domain-containing protein [Kordiimonadaceae bacterium]|nr:DUF721 domain-containing protein [Kordiimonadaceae bacterium]
MAKAPNNKADNKPDKKLPASVAIPQKAKPAGKQAAKRPFRYFKAQKASNLTFKLMSSAMRAKGFAQAEIIQRWAQIVGPELAAATVPIRLVFPRGEKMGAKLVIRCASAFAPLVAHKHERIMEMVNSFFGYGAVAKIEIKQGPLPKRRIKPQLTKHKLSSGDKAKLEGLVGDDEESPLRQALNSLGQMVLSNKK